IIEETRAASAQASGETADCQLQSLIDNLSGIFRAHLNSGHLNLVLDGIDNLSERVLIDETRFSQVLINLTTLLLLQSEQVELALGWSKDKLTFELSCQDFGNTSLEALNLKFNTDVLALLSGTLEAKKEQQILKLSGQIQAKTTTAQYEDPAFDFNGRSIMIAEDSFGLSRMIEIYLQENSYGVLLADNGKAAVQMAESYQPDVILMDLQMPVMDGFEATRTLRERNFSNPIIAMSASTLSSDQEKALSVGCNTYMTKPIDPATLLGKIEALLAESSD
ncbi:MAG: response regulator, partial [Pseudomonadota bacterium]